MTTMSFPPNEPVAHGCRRPFITWRALLCVAFFGAAQGWSQPLDRPPPEDLTQLSLRQLMQIQIDTVYTASKHPQRTAEAPSSTSVITGEEIQKYGHRTLAEVLRSVRGLYVSSDRNYSYLGMRGFNRPGDYNTRVLLLVNGHRMNDNIYDAALIGTEFILDVDLIERVEVIRGPASSLYGNSAFFGVINVITKTGAELAGIEASGEIARFDTYKGRMSYGGKFDSGVSLLLSGSLYGSDGPGRLFFKEFADPKTNFGIANGLDRDDAKSLFGVISYRDFSLSGGYLSREKNIPTAAFGTVFNDPRARTTDAPAYIDLKYQHEFADSTEVMARVAYDRYRYNGDYPYDYVGRSDPRDVVINRDGVQGDWWSTELQARRQFFDRLNLTLGTEYRDNFRQDQMNFDLAPFSSYLQDERSSYNVGVYGQGEFTVLTNLLLSAGVRYDYYDTFGGTVNPRLGLIYTPRAGSTFKALYGQAFRAPNAYELYYESVQFRGNPALTPERISTYELVYEQSLPRDFRFVVAGYYYKIADLISQQSKPGSDLLDPADDVLFFDNVDKVNARGVEFGLERQYPGGLMGRASFALQRAQDANTRLQLSNSPRHLAKLNLVVPLVKDKLFTGVELQYASSVRTLANAHADDYWIANATLFSQKLMKGMDLSATVYNLFDKEYGYPGAAEHVQDVIPQDGRAFRVKLTYRF